MIRHNSGWRTHTHTKKGNNVHSKLPHIHTYKHKSPYDDQQRNGLTTKCFKMSTEWFEVSSRSCITFRMSENKMIRKDCSTATMVNINNYQWRQFRLLLTESVFIYMHYNIIILQLIEFQLSKLCAYVPYHSGLDG